MHCSSPRDSNPGIHHTSHTWTEFFDRHPLIDQNKMLAQEDKKRNMFGDPVAKLWAGTFNVTVSLLAQKPLHLRVVGVLIHEKTNPSGKVLPMELSFLSCQQVTRRFQSFRWWCLKLVLCWTCSRIGYGSNNCLDRASTQPE